MDEGCEGVRQRAVIIKMRLLPKNSSSEDRVSEVTERVIELQPTFKNRFE